MTPDPKDQEFLATLRLLYVEDEADIRQQTAHFLGWRVRELVVAKDGVEGLAAFREQAPDLVVTDILMPGLDGLSMVAEIREQAPHLPIIVTTAFDQTAHLLRAIEVRVNHYVVKPIDTDLLETDLLLCARQLRIEREALRLEAETLRLRQQEALGIMAQGLAHDFNNLLQAILGWAALAQVQAEPGSKVAKALENMASSEAQAKALTQQLSLLGEPERLNARGPLEDILKAAVQEALQGSLVTAEFGLEDRDTVLCFNRAHLGQVFTHLCWNAREAMQNKGTLSIASQLCVLPEENPYAVAGGEFLHLAFTDDGPGIDPELLPRIYDPYFTTKRNYSQKGMGLGLALCQSIVRHHRGAIYAESQPGKGSTFHLYLPVAK